MLDVGKSVKIVVVPEVCQSVFSRFYDGQEYLDMENLSIPLQIKV